MTHRSVWTHVSAKLCEDRPTGEFSVQILCINCNCLFHQSWIFLCDFSINPIDPDEVPEIDFAGDE